MDKQFIDNIVDAYFIDNKIFESDTITKKYYADIILNTMRELRETDLEMYNEAYDCSRLCQQKIIKNFLDINFKDIDSEENLEESAILTTLGAVASGVGSAMTTLPFWGGFAAVVFLLYQGRISTPMFKFINFIAKKWNTVFSWLSKQGTGVQIRYAIIQKNTEQCYRSCEVDPKNVNLSHYSGTSRHQPWWGTLSSVEPSQKGECLRECFVDTIISSIDLLMKEYFTCLQKSSVDITNAEDDIIKFISRMSNSSYCSTYYNHAKDIFEQFDKVLDFIYKSTPEEQNNKQLKIQQLREKLYKTRVFVQNNNTNKPFIKKY